MYQACVSTLIIQIVPIFFIYAINFVFLGSKSLRDKVIYLMISFAIGGLLGDVFFHTLPHMSSHYHDHDHHHDHHDHHDHHHHDHAGHSHSHNPKEMCNNSIIMTGIIGFFLLEKLVANCLGHSHSHDHSGADKKVEENKKGSKKGNKGKKNEEEDQERLLRYRSYAVISLVGDFIHNFTDGLSIGVAYIASKNNCLITFRLQDGTNYLLGNVLP